MNFNRVKGKSAGATLARQEAIKKMMEQPLCRAASSGRTIDPKSEEGQRIIKAMQAEGKLTQAS
jgi:hypothetical protein